MKKQKYPIDIFTEPEIDDNTLMNLGPLKYMAGTFEGKKGKDVNPKAAGPERNSYTEVIRLEPMDPQKNGPQYFYPLRYHQLVNKPGEDGIFHDQVGHWLWEPATNTIIQTLSIPRGQVAMAMGKAKPNATAFELHARRDTTVNGICSGPFLEYAFKTLEYSIKVEILSENSWSYGMDTLLEVYGYKEPFHHTDKGTLIRIAQPVPNILAAA
jgi:hypothetical protein